MDESSGEERSEGNLFAYFSLSDFYFICIYSYFAAFHIHSDLLVGKTYV